MHITFSVTDEHLKQCVGDLKKIQDELSVGVQITEFDLSLGEKETQKVIGEHAKFTYKEVYIAKRERIKAISEIFKSIELEGISYWSLTDRIDCNRERVVANLMTKGFIKTPEEVPTVCGGVFPTSEAYVKSYRHERSEQRRKTRSVKEIRQNQNDKCDPSD